MNLVLDQAALLIDDPVALRVVGAPPHRIVGLRAETTDSHGVVFRSRADYEADADGSVVPARQAPRAGTYQGVDPFGLWWSMTAPAQDRFARDLRPVATRVAVAIDDQEVARVDFERARIAPGVQVEDVREAGLVATLFLPEVLPAPGVIVVGGSEGGLAPAEELAALLASHGLASLALAYFGFPGLPAMLSDVPLEYLETAIDLLLCRPGVTGDGVGMIGSSRGGELALVLASTCDRVRAVVGFAASSVVWPGFTPGVHQPRPAWTRRGRGLAFAVPRPRQSRNPDGSLVLRSWFAAALGDEPGLAEARIPVEQIRGAVLLVSGEDDQMWPSSWLAERAIARLIAAPVPGSDRHLHLSYPDAGHGLGHPPGLPEPPSFTRTRDGSVLALGGTRSGNAHAAQRAWPRALDFLAVHLGAPRPAPVTRSVAR